jgi:hypothetical protein
MLVASESVVNRNNLAHLAGVQRFLEVYPPPKCESSGYRLKGQHEELHWELTCRSRESIMRGMK